LSVGVPSGLRSPPSGRGGGVGAQPRTESSQSGAEDEVFRQPSMTEHELEELRAMPTVKQLRQKFSSLEQDSISADVTTAPRRVSHGSSMATHELRLNELLFCWLWSPLIGLLQSLF